MTSPLYRQTEAYRDPYIAGSYFFMENFAKTELLFSYPQAVSPTSYIDDVILFDYLSPETGLGPSEQLYTARGA